MLMKALPKILLQSMWTLKMIMAQKEHRFQNYKAKVDMTLLWTVYALIIFERCVRTCPMHAFTTGNSFKSATKILQHPKHEKSN
jgi:hypothetical protein